MRSIVFSIVFILMASQCTKVPLTGREQLSLIPEADMIAMSEQQYKVFLSQNKLSTDVAAITMVRRVGLNIQRAVEKFMADNKMSDRLTGYNWEFNLVESKEVNAWCMPGGKVVVYTGILPVTIDEASLAVVLGHEISHAVARHGSERMSQELLAQLGGITLAVAIQSKPQQTQDIFKQVFGIGANYGVLMPYSRKHESEADHLGLIFMSMAGYDPTIAVSFWERMDKLIGSQQPPEFLSTHPSDATRIAAIKKEIPEAMKYYKKP